MELPLGTLSLCLGRSLLGRKRGDEYATSKPLILRGNQVTMQRLFHVVGNHPRSKTIRQNLSDLKNREEDDLGLTPDATLLTAVLVGRNGTANTG